MQIDSDLVASYGKTPMDLRIFDGWLLVDEGKGTAFVSPIFAQNKSHPFNLENNSSLPYFFSHPFIENSPNFCVPAFTPLIFIIMLGIILDSIIGYYTYKLYRRTKYFCFQSLELDLYKSTTFK
jgi:hypothetical protein